MATHLRFSITAEAERIVHVTALGRNDAACGASVDYVSDRPASRSAVRRLHDVCSECRAAMERVNV